MGIPFLLEYSSRIWTHALPNSPSPKTGRLLWVQIVTEQTWPGSEYNEESRRIFLRTTNSFFILPTYRRVTPRGLPPIRQGQPLVGYHTPIDVGQPLVGYLSSGKGQALALSGRHDPVLIIQESFSQYIKVPSPWIVFQLYPY